MSKSAIKSEGSNVDFIKGIIYTIISAFVYGLTPILAKLTYAEGNNSVSLTFFRVLFAIPFLYFLTLKNGVSLTIKKKNLFKLILLSFLGIGITTTTLYESYNYISVGMATTIHFVYPCVVYFIYILFFKEHFNLKTLLALIFSMIGIIILIDEIKIDNLFGVFLAGFSGITYGLYLVYLDKSGLKEVNPFKVTMYVSLINVVGLYVFGEFTDQLIFSLTPIAWVYTILIAFLTSIFGVSFLQLGVKYCGATTASILSTLEPITSIVLGVMFLNESITILKIIGCILIIIAVLLLSIRRK